MPRKSKAQRKKEVENLLAEYMRDPLKVKHFDWEVLFLTDIFKKLTHDRVLSKRQRNKVDLMIEEGVRSVPTLEKSEQAEFDLVFKYFKGTTKGNAADDFLNKRLKGYNLSDKQNAWFIRARIQQNGEWKSTNQFGLVVTGPSINSSTRCVAYDILINGKIENYAYNRIYKRRV